MHTAKYSEVEASNKNCHTDIYCKNRSCTCSEMLNPIFSKHSVIRSFTCSSSQCFEVPTALICRWCLVFTELTWNLSIRSKATWAKSFLMLLAYRKQIIQNQSKTVRKVVTINVCWQRSSCEPPPLATSHAKVANSGSGKMVIARYHIHFFQKRAALSLTLLEN